MLLFQVLHKESDTWYLTECLNECVGITMTTYLCFHRDQMKKLWWIRVGPAQFSTFTMRKKSWKVRTAVPCDGGNSERQPVGGTALLSGGWGLSPNFH